MRYMMSGALGIAGMALILATTSAASAAQADTAVIPQAAYFKSVLDNIDRSSPESLTQAGDMHRLGVGTEKNIQEAFKYYHAASKMKHGPAQNRIAQLYLNGEGVKKDSTKGIAWLQEAASNGDLAAMTDLAARYALGIGIEADKKKSRYWVVQADKALNDMRTRLNAGQTIQQPSAPQALPRVKPTEKALQQRAQTRSGGNKERDHDPYGLGNL